MKSVRILFLLFIAFLISACTNPVVMEETSVEKKASGGKNVTVFVDGNNVVNFKSAASKILMPYALNTDELYFYFWGTSLTDISSVIEMQEVHFSAKNESGTVGICNIAVPAGSYALYLAATKTPVDLTTASSLAEAVTKVNKMACVAGYSKADMRYAREVYFNLSPYSATSTGSLELEIYFNWNCPSGLRSITAGLYNILTGDEVLNEDGYSAKVTFLNDSRFIKPAPEGSPNFSVQNLKPGLYNFAVRFEYTDRVYTYNDTAVVMSKQVTEDVIEIPQIIIDKPNVAPSNFIAGYAAPDSSDEEYFYAEFSWDNACINEDYLQLEILDITSLDLSSYGADVNKVISSTETLTEKDSAWNKLSSKAGVIPYIYNPSNYGDAGNAAFQNINADGSLLANNNYIVYKFGLARKYIARICNVNGSGKSAYTYLDFTNAGRTTLKSTNLSAVFKAFPSDSTSVNVFRLSYNYNFGCFRDNTTSDVVSVQHDYYVPQTFSGQKIIKPVDYDYRNNGSSAATLKYDDAVSGRITWKKWLKDSTSGSVFVNDTDADSSYYYYEGSNITLYAYYNGNEQSPYSLSFSDNPAAGALSADIMLFGGNTSTVNIEAGGANRIEWNASDNYFEVDRSQYKYIYIVLNNMNDRFSGSSNCSVEASDGITYTYKAIPALHSVSFKALDFVLDISDEDIYYDGIFYMSMKAIPSNNMDNEIQKLIKFQIVN